MKNQMFVSDIMLLFVSENGCISKRNGELTQFKPCNYGTSVCVINHRSDFDQITLRLIMVTTVKINKLHILFQFDNHGSVLYTNVFGISYTDIIEHIHRLEHRHMVFVDQSGINPFMQLDLFYQIQNNGSSSTMITQSLIITLPKSGLIIGL